jgi:hypothetical protein
VCAKVRSSWDTERWVIDHENSATNLHWFFLVIVHGTCIKLSILSLSRVTHWYARESWQWHMHQSLYLLSLE